MTPQTATFVDTPTVITYQCCAAYQLMNAYSIIVIPNLVVVNHHDDAQPIAPMSCGQATNPSTTITNDMLTICHTPFDIPVQQLSNAYSIIAMSNLVVVNHPVHAPP